MVGYNLILTHHSLNEVGGPIVHYCLANGWRIHRIGMLVFGGILQRGLSVDLGKISIHCRGRHEVINV